MNAMKLENLDLKLEDEVVFMKVSGGVSKEEMAQGLDWFETITSANDNINIRVDMVKDDFDGLGELRSEFVRVGQVLRKVPEADKCALVTDSQFLRSSAKVESAVIPGLEIRSFGTDETDPAEKWLKGESLIASPHEKSEQSKPQAVVAPSAGKAEGAGAAQTTETPAKSAWDNFTAIDLV